MDKVNILGVHVDMAQNISQATDCIMRFLDEDKFHAVYTPNSEIIMLAYKDEKFCKLLNNVDLFTADGHRRCACVKDFKAYKRTCGRV